MSLKIILHIWHILTVAIMIFLPVPRFTCIISVDIAWLSHKCEHELIDHSDIKIQCPPKLPPYQGTTRNILESYNQQMFLDPMLFLHLLVIAHVEHCELTCVPVCGIYVTLPYLFLPQYPLLMHRQEHISSGAIRDHYRQYQIIPLYSYILAL